MLRLTTGLTLAALGLGLMILLLVITGVGTPSNTASSNVAIAQDSANNNGIEYTLETGELVSVDPENTLVIDLVGGKVIIQLLPQFAPNHVARIKELARQGFYDGIVWHRVIDGFMAQTGDPDGRGTGGSGQKLAAEFNDVAFNRGIVGMARSQSPDSADSQFFIMFDRGYFLNGKYTAWGRVVQGMDQVDAIKKGDANANGSVTDPDQMLKVYVLADTL